MYDLDDDLHETIDLTEERPDVVTCGLADVWRDERMGGNLDAPDSAADPLWQVLREGGPFHLRGPDDDRLCEYVE